MAVAEKAKVSYSWLSKFFNGHIDNPGYATLTRLHACLTEGAAETTSRGLGTEPPATPAEAKAA